LTQYGIKEEVESGLAWIAGHTTQSRHGGNHEIDLPRKARTTNLFSCERDGTRFRKKHDQSSHSMKEDNVIYLPPGFPSVRKRINRTQLIIFGPPFHHWP
jgi:hypothetical protein